MGTLSDARRVMVGRRETDLMRVAVALALGCLAIAHGSTELDNSVYDIGETGDLSASLKEREIEDQVAQEDPSLAHFDINSRDQEDRIGGDASAFDDGADTSQKAHRDNPAEPADTMQAELHAIEGDEREPALIGEAQSEDKEEAPQTEKIEGAADNQEKGTKENERTGKESDKALEKKQKEDEKTNKEEERRAAEKRKAENTKKENQQKVQQRKEEAAEKEQQQAQEDEEKSAKMETQLQKARADAEKDAKDESKRELADK